MIKKLEKFTRYFVFILVTLLAIFLLTPDVKNWIQTLKNRTYAKLSD